MEGYIEHITFGVPEKNGIIKGYCSTHTLKIGDRCTVFRGDTVRYEASVLRISKDDTFVHKLPPMEWGTIELSLDIQRADTIRVRKENKEQIFFVKTKEVNHFQK